MSTIHTLVQYRKISLRLLFTFLFISSLNIQSSFAETKKNSSQISDLVAFCSSLKGFNLLGKFDVSWSNQGFTEKDFSVMHDLGFNFARLPLDYRTFTTDGNWEDFIELEVVEIDSAVAWGIRHNVHVCINLHRAPGYCINNTTLPANQQLNLWTDQEAQDAFVNQWYYFANRYKDISPENLSFNLVNEPSNVTSSVYVPIMKRAIDTIHTVSPNRVIFVDALNIGRDLILELKDEPNVAQSMHSYDPFGITHYKAEWVSGSADMPVPKWPVLQVSNYLYGSWKTEFKSPLVIEGNFPAGSVVTVNVRQVSIESVLQIKADTKIILSKKFVCSADTGADFSAIVKTEWGYQNISNKDFSATTTSDATKISIENTLGDWMIINSINIKIGSKNFTFSPGDDTWGNKQAVYVMDSNGSLTAKDGSALLPFENYRKSFEIAKANNIAFMVQEFGVYNKTPHNVTIAFLTDLAKLFRDNNIGWALWNFSGSFGILNSDRADCIYETYQGFKLDRQMLDALTIAPVVQVIDFKIDNSLVAFPCPANDYIYVRCNDFKSKTEFGIIDITGRLLRTYSMENAGLDIFKLDINQLSPSTYILYAVCNGVKYSKKIIVQP